MEDAASECRRWRALADLLDPDAADARAALLGAPLGEKSLTPGRCDLGPKVVREALKRFSVYDVETGVDLGELAVRDGGDLFLKTLTPEEAFAPIKTAAAALAASSELVLMLGGNNAVTRPGVHGLVKDGGLERVGLITLDAHFDLRDTDCGLLNGNPVRALVEDGLPGANIAQIGLAPFANTARMHAFAAANGIAVYTMSMVRARGAATVAREALARIAPRVDAVFVDFDIDVIDRAQCPGAPGARPGGMSADDFFAATRVLCAHPKVRAVDLTEFDPSLDVADITALTAGRWACECLAGLAARAGETSG